VESCLVENALIAEGSVVVQSEIRHALIGIRARLGRGSRISDSLILGADYYETAEEVQQAASRGLPPVGIGDDTIIRRAIVDKNARIGRGVRILNEAGAQEKDGEGYFIREGIVIIPKGAAIADGTVI
jgi:glucose-1-phosphate adenylyltransferase